MSVAPTSSLFAQKEYYLQLSLAATTPKLLELIQVQNAHLSAQFHKRNDNMNVLPCWIRITNAEDNNLISNRGIELRKGVEGIKVTHGAVPPNVEKVGNEGNRFRVLLALVAVGRSIPADSEQDAMQAPLPDGYDSYYLPESSDAGKYRHEYIIKQSTQILPQCVCVYEFDLEKEKRSRMKAKCDNCEAKEATVFCAADSANLCAECDHKLHTANKLASRHIRTPLGKGTDVYGACRIHTDKVVEFFCSECHTPVCVYCKMVGHHSSGENAKHKLVPVSEAYETVLKEIEIPDSTIQNRTSLIKQQNTEVQNKAKAVQALQAQLRAQIDEIYRTAVAELDLCFNQKLTKLEGDSYELSRQAGEITRLENFVRYQQSGGDATAFLFNWSRHQQLRDELHRANHQLMEAEVGLDVKALGDIKIISSDPVPLPKRPQTPVNRTATSKHISSPNSKQSPITVGIANRLAERKSGRNTSEYFADALGVLDELGGGVSPVNVDYHSRGDPSSSVYGE